MEIRRMKTSDVPAIIHLGARMHEESQYSILNFLPEKVVEKCHQVINHQQMLGLVAIQDGNIIAMIGGQIAAYEYGDDLVASDILVYVDPAHRASRAFLMLVKGYVQWAKEQGASMIFMSQTTGVNMVAVGNLYTRLGFEPVGGIYRMAIGG